jgi:hypothetical protein
LSPDWGVRDRDTRPRVASISMVTVAVLLPQALGILEKAFIGLLGLLVVLVGLFALFVISQQFRNPGRGPGAGRPR